MSRIATLPKEERVMGMPPEPLAKMTRVKRVVTSNINNLEDAVNEELARIEASGQEVKSVQFDFERTGMLASAFIVYRDNAGIQEKHAERHGSWLDEMNQQALARSEGESAARERQKQQTVEE